jgi:hypothetical protein
VVQVSGSTVNRLLAALHPNAFVDSSKPSFPHVVSIRIGDPTPIRGHRGWVQAQVGAPRVELIHGSTDRFHLEVGVRARYRGATLRHGRHRLKSARRIPRAPSRSTLGRR